MFAIYFLTKKSNINQIEIKINIYRKKLKKYFRMVAVLPILE